MQPIRMRAATSNGITELLVLMPHPMETGLRKDAAGAFIPAHYITEVQISSAGRVLLQARMGLAVARDPLLSLRFRGGTPGMPIHVRWTDNRGLQRSDSTTL